MQNGIAPPQNLTFNKRYRNSRQTLLTENLGNQTQLGYDTLDRQVSMSFMYGSTRTSKYDEADDVVTYTDENGSVFTNTFDSFGRKTAVSILPASGVGGTTAQALQYDGLSRLTFARDTSGGNNADVAIYYDSLGRKLMESKSTAATPATW